MYKVYCDETIVYNPEIDETALIEPVIELEENKAGSFSFGISCTHPAHGTFARRKSVVTVYQDDEIVFCGPVIDVQEDFYKTQQIYCEGELTYLNDSIQRQARYQDISVRGLLEAYINSHNSQVEASKQFEIGSVTVTDPNDSLYRYTNMESTMSAIGDDLVDSLGGIIRVRYADGKRYIDYLADAPNTCSQIIKLGKNLIDYTSNIDSADIATSIIPLGKRLEQSAVDGLETRLDIKSVNDGKDYVYSQTAVDAYGWITKVVTWDDVTQADNLKRKGEQYLSDIQYENVVIQAAAVDLRWMDASVERFKLSDDIRVVSEPHGLDRFFRLTSQTLHLNAPETDTITLGKNEQLSLSARTNQTNEEIKKAIEQITPTSDILQAAKDNASNLIKMATNGNIVMVNDENGNPKELLIMDTNDINTAKKVWRWNLNGLGYSSTGYNGTFGTAMTMDGKIVADYILAGIIKGIEINNGNGTFRVDANGNVKAVSGLIGGWNINGTAIYKDIIDPNNNNNVYRVYFQPPMRSALESTWILSCQKSTDGGKNFIGTFVLYSDGSALFGRSKACINPDGSAYFANNQFRINADGTILVNDLKGFSGSIDVNGHSIMFANGICMNIT